MKPPTAEELSKNSTVKAAFEAAWADSLADDEVLRHEEGGWILMDTTDGRILIRRVMPGERAAVSFSEPRENPPLVILAMFHTHPLPLTEEIPDPSGADRLMSRDWKIPSFVIAESAIFIIDTNGNVSLGEWK